MGNYIPSGQIRFRTLDAPLPGIHVREYLNYYVHTYGAFDYIPSGILSTYDRA